MDSTIVKKLIKLNKDFYNKTATDFSSTRQYSWGGWEDSFKFLGKEFLPKNILDVGCGNGRFLSFLTKKIPQFSYLGIDNSKELISIARNQKIRNPYISVNFELLDITSYENLKGLKGSYDFIAMIAVLHHIPGVENQKKLLRAISKKLTPNGVMIFTTWNFINEKSISKKLISWNELGIDKTYLEEGDYLLDWNLDKNSLRYCHYFTKDEILNITSDLPIKLLYSFESDGRNNKLNSYYIWKSAT